jgi:hypothetical protein
MSPLYRYSRIIAAALLVATALFHVVLAVRGDGSVVRHAVFVVINLGLAAVLVVRPRWAFFPALVLTFQQLWSHGEALSDSFVGSGKLDWVSLAVCLFFPTLVTILFMERRDEDEAAALAASEKDDER